MCDVGADPLNEVGHQLVDACVATETSKRRVAHEVAAGHLGVRVERRIVHGKRRVFFCLGVCRRAEDRRREALVVELQLARQDVFDEWLDRRVAKVDGGLIRSVL